MAIKKIEKFIKDFDPSEIDPKYKDYLTKVHIMTGAGVVQLLNGCVARMNKNNCYLEVGTHRGSTLLGSALDNKHMCYGVDNFTGHTNQAAPFNTIEEGLQDAIKRMSGGNVKYFKEDYKSFFKDREDVDGKKVEVYFYDGSHQKEDQYLGLKLVTPCLTDKAIVIVDDVTFQDCGKVMYGVNKILGEDERFSILRRIDSEEKNNKDGMWQGVIILKFERKK